MSLDEKKQELIKRIFEDEYTAGLWSYHLEAPEMGMRSREDLQRLFYQNEFKFAKGAYQPGELAFLAAFSERLLQSMIENRAKDAERFKDMKEEEVPEEDQKKLQQLEEVIRVTTNRRTMVLKNYAEWIHKLPEIAFYASAYTEEPYIDAHGRVFVYCEKESVKKAVDKAEGETDYELRTLPPAELSEKLYRNGCEVLVFNDGVIAFTASREEIFGASEADQGAEEERISDANRALRFFALAFMQVLRSDTEKDKRPLLTQFEAQMAPRLLQSMMFFALSENADDKLSFAVFSDENGHQAIAAYTDKAAVPEESRFSYKEMSFFAIAQKLLTEGEELDGIIVNPGELNFLLDKNWLSRLTGFGEYLMQRHREAEEKKEKEGE